MWNNLRSDMYRMFHMRAFYITLIIGIAIAITLNVTTGIEMSSIFANFSLDKNTYGDFMYYALKSPWYVLLVLIFLCIFHNDEYDKGFAKNTFPITFKKSTLIIERYILNVLICMIFLVVILFFTTIVHFIFANIPNGNLDIVNYCIYAFVEILLICAVASFLMMINHITKSRVLIIVITCLYAMMMIYMLEGSIIDVLFGNSEPLSYTMYQTCGKLPTIFSWKGYRLAFIVLIGNTLLYNTLSYMIVKKKDL